MNRLPTQQELDLARLGMTIARTTIKCMSAAAIALEQTEAANQFAILELQLKDLCEKIFTGEICA